MSSNFKDLWKEIRSLGFWVAFLLLIIAFLSWMGISPSSNTQSTIGNQNTFINFIPKGKVGSGNTVIGATDDRGNVIFDQGGTAIGTDACAGSTSVAIGAYASAGGCDSIR